MEATGGSTDQHFVRFVSDRSFGFPEVSGQVSPLSAEAVVRALKEAPKRETELKQLQSDLVDCEQTERKDWSLVAMVEPERPTLHRREKSNT